MSNRMREHRDAMEALRKATGAAETAHDAAMNRERQLTLTVKRALVMLDDGEVNRARVILREAVQ